MLPRRPILLAAALIACLHASAPAQAPLTPPPLDGRIVIFGGLRVRFEDWSFFRAKTAEGSYAFGGSLLRLGAVRSTASSDYLIEVAQPTLLGLPRHASGPAPVGQLGLGASYFDSIHGDGASLFVKQAFIRVRLQPKSKSSVRVGRFEFGDGAETTAADPTLNWLKLNRIASRLIGTFGFTTVQRSFDGIHLTNQRKNSNFTGLAVFPTRGVFDLKGMDTLTDIKVLYAAQTFADAGKSPSDTRLFGIYYEDTRNGAVKTDNRPLASRKTDRSALRIYTVGAHFARVIPIGGGKLDLLAWGAGQTGDWGRQSHEAGAFDAEVGFQPHGWALKPWFRAGYYYASGDGNSTNGKHGTFFPLLPTPRIYARFPFYTETNIQDAFVQLILRPTPKLTIRSDVHDLKLADSHDLWYAGGGAFNNSAFGFSGRPSGGHRNLATLIDFSADYQASRNLSLTAYLAYANGGSVVATTFQGRDAGYFYGEMNYRF